MNPRKSITFDVRTNGNETSFTYFNFIGYTEGGKKNVIIPKGVGLIVESSTAPSESTTYFISTTLIEGHELQGTGLYQRKVKFTSRTPVCIFSSRIKYQLDSVNYSRYLMYRVFQSLDHGPAVFITLPCISFSRFHCSMTRATTYATIVRLYIDYFLSSLHPCKSYSNQYAN